MSDQTCSGYTNHSTWLLALYSDNERDIHAAKQRMFLSFTYTETETITPQHAQQFVRDSRLVNRLNFNETSFVLYKVDWNDIAQCWTDELEEYKRYHVKA